MAIGPSQMPPQGQKALVRALFSRGNDYQVSCTLVSEHPGDATLEFLNEGDEVANDLRYIVATKDGLISNSIGQLPPGAAAPVTLRNDVTLDPFRCVWTCRDRKGRRHIWAYDGGHRRLGKRDPMSDEDSFRLMYS